MSRDGGNGYNKIIRNQVVSEILLLLWFQDFERTHEVVADNHHATRVVELATVVRR